ncbi:MAG TPA: hypothetical protein VKM55_01625 [Candidatus Lokiarchaeia archaeon]|nr:hypothetical protein [Candidatus Lokiarchaeia archaeon]
MSIRLDTFGLSIKPIISCDIASFQTNILNYGYSDLSFFPSWQEFSDRSEGKKPEYQDYMAYVVFKNESVSPIGIVAVQFTTYEKLKEKVPIVVPEYKWYLYLSWIAIETEQQDRKYFEILFHFYKSIVKQLATDQSTKIGGAAILIRRMRPLFVNLLNVSDSCPRITDRTFSVENNKMQMVFMPSETLKKPPAIPQDYMMIIFYTIDESIK